MRAVIFDMDGVLSDTQSIHGEIEADLVNRYGGSITPDELAQRYAGVPTRVFLRELIAISDEELETLMHEKETRYLAAIQQSVPAVPGALELLVRVKSRGMKVAVASGSGPSTVSATLKGLGIAESFDAVVTADDVEHGKPAPDVFLEAARRIGVEPSECIVIEDGVAGMQGARTAGMRVIALATHDREYPADFVVHALSEITDEMLQ